MSTEEYNEFYKNTFKEYLDPLASSHFTTEVIPDNVSLHVAFLNNHQFLVLMCSLVGPVDVSPSN